MATIDASSLAFSTRSDRGNVSVTTSPAFHTRFEREATPLQVAELRYDTRAALLARGVIPSPRRRYPPVPHAFPGFVPDPPAAD